MILQYSAAWRSNNAHLPFLQLKCSTRTARTLIKSASSVQSLSFHWAIVLSSPCIQLYYSSWRSSLRCVQCTTCACVIKAANYLRNLDGNQFHKSYLQNPASKQTNSRYNLSKWLCLWYLVQCKLNWWYWLNRIPMPSSHATKQCSSGMKTCCIHTHCKRSMAAIGSLCNRYKSLWWTKFHD